jgi:hypothetical protein
MYFDYKKEYDTLLRQGDIKQLYPELSGCWLKDLRKFIPKRMEENNQIKTEQALTKTEEKPKIIWKL